MGDALAGTEAAGAPGAATGDAPAAAAPDASCAPDAAARARTADPIISCEGVRYTYDGETYALDGVDLQIGRGEFVCLLGGNGSGKSTLARHLNALLVPDGGRVTVRGLDTADPEYVYDIRSTVGLVFQNPDDQIVATLVEDDVAFGPENLGVASDDIARRVEACLRDVGLMRFERHETHALSGGQKQRVAIAGALAMHPAVLVLDEASSMLDPRGRKGLLRVCRALNGQGMTIVMITHYMEEAAAADRVVVLDRGKIALEGTPQEVLTQVERLSELNLEVPYACELGRALRRRGVPVAPRVDEAAMVAEVERVLGERGAAARPGRPRAQALPAGDAPAAPAADGRPDAAPAAGGAGADAEAGGACLELRHVCYTYEPSARERKRRRRLRRRGRGAERAAWGGDPDAVWALRDVSLTVRAGEFLGIAGHTGSGKSTLLQHLNGLEHPARGQVLAFGEDLAGKRAAEAVKTRVGVVFQYPEHQLFANTVFEDVAFGPRNLGLPEDEVGERVREALELVGLPFEQVARRSPFALSGGQQRRCAFAGVLAMRPEVLVLDEPAAGLDPASRREFLSLVAGLHARGLTVVMVSHSMDDLAALCDRIVIMNEGEVLRCGTPREVFAREDDLVRVGLGVPAGQRMARALRDDGVPLEEGRLYSVEGLADAIARLCAEGGEDR